MLKVICFCLCVLVAMGAAVGSAMAQSWPPKLTRIVVPYLTGTSPDVLARMLADRLAKRTGQAFIVENKPGANSIIGTSFVAKAPADGATWLLVDRLALGVNPLLYSPLPYDTRKDIASITNVGDSFMFLVAREDFPASSFRELVSYAKASPGKVIFGSGGSGHISHLNMEAMQAGAGIEFLHVPFKGIADVIPALLSGTVQVTVSGVGNVQKLVEDKRLKLLAVGAPSRSRLAPSVPTIREAGGTDDMLLSTSFSLHARGGTPAPVLEKIAQEVNSVLADPEVASFMRLKGIEPTGTSPVALDRLMDGDEKVLTKLVRDRNIKVQ